MTESRRAEVGAPYAPSSLEHILVPLDGSALAEGALPVAAHLAERVGAEVWPLTVIPPLSDDAAASDVPPDVEVVRDPDPARAIIEAASQPATLLAMATHGRGRVGEMVLGSVAEAILRRHDRPVLLVGPEGGAVDVEFERVMVCVDGSRLAETMMPVAERWSRDLGVALEIVQVVPTDVEARLARAGVPAGDVLESSYVHGLARRIGGNTDWEVLRADDPVDALLTHARPGTLLALATHGRGGLKRLVMGSVAMRLAHRSPHPLLVMRPRTAEEG